MTTIALVGPDGAGKTTLARHLEASLPMPAKYLYMGLNFDASNYLLPFNRLLVGRRASVAESGTRLARRSAGRLPRAVTAALGLPRAGLKLSNLLAEGFYRQAVARRYERQGFVVIYDRHFYSDYQPLAAAKRGLRGRARRIRRALLARAMAKPDLMIYLDAPPEVLLARKGEGTIESLGRQRQAYLRLGAELPSFAIVNTHRAIDEVADEVVGVAREFLETSRRHGGDGLEGPAPSGGHLDRSSGVQRRKLPS